MNYNINLNDLSNYSYQELYRTLTNLAHKIDMGSGLRVNQTFLEVVSKAEATQSKEVVEGLQKVIKIAEEKGFKESDDLRTLSQYCQKIIGKQSKNEIKNSILLINKEQIPIHKIFKNLTAKEAIMRLVNEPDHHLLEYADISDYYDDLDNECIEILANNCPNIKHLYISSFIRVQGDVLKCLKKFPGLQTLSIDGGRLDKDTLKYLEYVPGLQSLKIYNRNFEPDTLKHLKYVPLLRHLNVAGCSSLEFDVLKHLERVPLLLSLNIGDCTQFPSDVLKFLEFTPLLENLDIHWCSQLEPDALERLNLVPKLKSLNVERCNLEAAPLQGLDKSTPFLQNLNIKGFKELLTKQTTPPFNTKFHPSARMEEVILMRDKVSLEEMNDWSNFVVRDKNWDKLSQYSNKGTQEPYGRKMEQAVHVVTNLIKENTPFSALWEYAATLRSLMAMDLKHDEAEKFGVIRVTPFRTHLGAIYEELGKYWQKKKYEIEKDNPFCELNDRGSLQIIGNLGNPKVKLSCMGSEFLHHTAHEAIPLIMWHANDLYNQALEEKDLLKVQELAGEMFWWICQAKPWDRGDPSIAEIIFRSIFEEKGIPNHSWKEGIVPWAEAMKDFDPKEFGRRFSGLFES